MHCNWFFIKPAFMYISYAAGFGTLKLKRGGNAAALKSTSRHLPKRNFLLASGCILIMPSDNNNNNNNSNFLFHI